MADKPRLIGEAVAPDSPGRRDRLHRLGRGTGPLSSTEAERFLRFMKFPTFESRDGYAALLGQAGCEVLAAEDTGRYSPGIDLYLNMLNMQLTYDALKIVGFDQSVMQALGAEMQFVQELAHAGKLSQGLFVARKPA